MYIIEEPGVTHLNRSPWDLAAANFHRADDIMRSCQRDHMKPAWERFAEELASRADEPASVTREQMDAAAAAVAPEAEAAHGRIEAAHGAQSAALRALVLTPSPDVAALALKMRVVLNNRVHEEVRYPGLAAAMLADAERFASG